MKKNFRFFDNRQKYLLLVTTTNDKNKIADALKPIVQKLKPKFPALKIFDAGMGAVVVMVELMQCSKVSSKAESKLVGILDDVCT